MTAPPRCSAIVATVAERGAIERLVYSGRDLTPLASVLAQLALALDEHGSPVDYARRRALVTSPDDVTLDLDAYTRLRLQHGWSAGSVPREAVLRWYLLVLLTGRAPGHPRGEEAVRPSVHRLPLPRARPAARLPAPAGTGQPRPARHRRTGHLGTTRTLGHLDRLARRRPSQRRPGRLHRPAGNGRFRRRGPWADS